MGFVALGAVARGAKKLNVVGPVRPAATKRDDVIRVTAVTERSRAVRRELMINTQSVLAAKYGFNIGGRVTPLRLPFPHNSPLGVFSRFVGILFYPLATTPPLLVGVLALPLAILGVGLVWISPLPVQSCQSLAFLASRFETVSRASVAAELAKWLQLAALGTPLGIRHEKISYGKPQEIGYTHSCDRPNRSPRSGMLTASPEHVYVSWGNSTLSRDRTQILEGAYGL